MCPELGGPHSFRVEPVEDEAAMARRAQRVREIAERVVGRHRGLRLGAITVEPGWHTLRVDVIREDVDEADDADEELAARQVKAALKQQAPDLVRSVVVEGKYCK